MEAENLIIALHIPRQSAYALGDLAIEIAKNGGINQYIKSPSEQAQALQGFKLLLKAIKADGYKPKRHNCTRCKDTHICKECNGTGGIPVSVYDFDTDSHTDDYYDCSWCNGTGQCQCNAGSQPLPSAIYKIFNGEQP